MYLELGEIQQTIPPHPLQPEGFVFADDDPLLVTAWGDVLPSVAFSAKQLEEMRRMAGAPTLLDDPRAVTLAQYLDPKITFDEFNGCWQLRIERLRNERGRLFYPQVNLRDLGYQSHGAHRATMEVFMGVDLPIGQGLQQQVDHRCRNQCCCNPYHLEVVTLAENNRRKDVALRRARQPDLFLVTLQQRVEEGLTFGHLKVLLGQAAVASAE